MEEDGFFQKITGGVKKLGGALWAAITGIPRSLMFAGIFALGGFGLKKFFNLPTDYADIDGIANNTGIAKRASIAKAIKAGATSVGIGMALNGGMHLLGIGATAPETPQQDLPNMPPGARNAPGMRNATGIKQ